MYLSFKVKLKLIYNTVFHMFKIEDLKMFIVNVILLKRLFYSELLNDEYRILQY